MTDRKKNKDENETRARMSQYSESSASRHQLLALQFFTSRDRSAGFHLTLMIKLARCPAQIARVASIVFYPNIQALFNFELNDFVLMFHFHCFILRVQSLDQDIQHLFLSSYLQHKICTHDKQGCYMQKHSFHFY